MNLSISNLTADGSAAQREFLRGYNEGWAQSVGTFHLLVQLLFLAFCLSLVADILHGMKWDVSLELEEKTLTLSGLLDGIASGLWWVIAIYMFTTLYMPPLVIS